MKDLHDDSSMIVTQEAIKALTYLTERQMDSKIKALYMFYRPKIFLGMVTGKCQLLIAPYDNYLTQGALKKMSVLEGY